MGIFSTVNIVLLPLSFDSRKPVEMFVAENVDPESFKVIDTGKVEIGRRRCEYDRYEKCNYDCWYC